MTRTFASALLVLASALPSQAAIFGPPTHTQVDVVVDFTPEGRKLVHPTPRTPAYYLPVVNSFQQLGAQVRGEKQPGQAQLIRLVAVELAKQGYLVMKPGPYLNARNELTYADGTVITVPSRPSQRFPLKLNAGGNVPLTWAMVNAPDGPYSFAAMHTEAALRAGAEAPPIAQILRYTDPVHGATLGRMPSLILVINYGYMNPVISNFTPGDATQQNFFNQSQMLALVGGNMLDHLDLDFERESVMQASEQNRYFVAVSAYDFRAYVNGRKKVLLWQAKMSAPSDGVGQFADVMESLVKAGGPFLGRPMDRPKMLVLPITPEGRVEIGTPTVQDYIDVPAPKPPPAVSGASPGAGH